MEEKTPRAKTEISVLHQGIPIVNSAEIYKRTDDIVLIEVEVEQKRVMIDSIFSDSIGTCGISIISSSAPFDDGTMISFSDFQGWEVWAAWASEHTISVCLVVE